MKQLIEINSAFNEAGVVLSDKDTELAKLSRLAAKAEIE